MGKKILVTGGTGYIGSHTCVELIKNGYDVYIVDDLSNSNQEVVGQIAAITGKTPHFTKLDLCNRDELFKYFEVHNDIFAAIHFAALKAVGESTTIPLKYYKTNINGLINLIEAMETVQCNQLVFSSSCTVYGQPDKLPVTEDSPIKTAMSPYANTKRICEEIITDYSLVSNIKSILLRYFNPIGAHQSALIGELPIGVPNNLVPYLTQTAIGKRECLSVFGSDYNTKDGTGIRDYIHVVDLAQAHVSALKRHEEGGLETNVEVFNLGTGKGYSVLEIIETFEKVNGVKVNCKIVDRRPGDIEKVWADPTKANNILGWKARYGLNEMLQSAWKWEKIISNKL